MWFAMPFLVALFALTSLRLWFADDDKSVPQVIGAALVPDNSMLVGQRLPTVGLIEAQSKLPATKLALAIPDTAVVILLGGVGCSDDQVQLLRYWSEQHSETGLQDYPVLAIYADPLMGVGPGIYESLLLRRASQATYPFLVSQDPEFNPRVMGFRTPQVVLSESQTITQVFDQPPKFNSMAQQ